jgi:hypothetical protein
VNATQVEDSYLPIEKEKLSIRTLIKVANEIKAFKTFIKVVLLRKKTAKEKKKDKKKSFSNPSKTAPFG